MKQETNVKAKRSTLNLCLCGLITAATITLSACSTSEATKKVVEANAFGPLTLNTQDYQTALNEASSDKSFKALILLTRSKIVSNDLDGAQVSVNDLYAKAQSAVQKDEAALVNAMLLTRLGQDEEANEVLSNVNYKALPKQDISYFLILNSNVNARLYKKNHDVKNEIVAFKSKSALLHYVTKKNDRLTILNQSVALLTQLDEKTLSNAINNVKNDVDKGFYEYAIISKSSNDDLKQQMIESFSQKYEMHPLGELIAANQTKARGVTPTETQEDSKVIVDNSAATNETAEPVNATPVNIPANAIFSLHDNDQIAVLLPLSGRFASIVGEPAKLGILTALKDRQSQAKVVFYDTNKTNISEIINTISSNGTKLIIGPVLKPEVTALNNSGIKIPSIVLNSPEGNKPVNQWYFDLGPNYEGAIAAAKIYADGHKKPVVIGQTSDTSSQRSVQSFMNTYSKVSKDAVICNYADPSAIKSALSACPLASADSAYVNASVIDAVSIKALIPSNVAVYLTDKSYMGVNNSAQEFALKGAQLGEMPWLVTDSPLKASFMNTLPKANPQVQRIFAAAYDSVNFAFSIENLAANKDDVLHGLSGDISLGNNGLIESTPMWVELGKLR